MTNEERWRGEFRRDCPSVKHDPSCWYCYLAARRAREAECQRLRAALESACTALHNDFEPDNQSREWHAATAALAAKEGNG